MSTSSIMIATAKVRPGMEAAFTDWQGRHDKVISQFPGYVSSDIMPPGTASEDWTIIITFQTPERLTAWQQSPERAALIGESTAFLSGGNLGETMTSAQDKPETNVTEVILTKLKPGMEDRYREWAVRIQSAQSKYPGYRGMYLQPPTTVEGRWTTLVRYATAENLEAWMAAPERAALLEESKAFIEHEELTRLATSFPGWVPIDPVSGEGPPNWKTAMLVLLGLFPIVMLEMKYLSPVLAAMGLHASLATFIGNVISVALTSFATMPLFVRWFGWWLFPKDASTAPVTTKGLVIICALFAIEVIALWKLLPW